MVFLSAHQGLWVLFRVSDLILWCPREKRGLLVWISGISLMGRNQSGENVSCSYTMLGDLLIFSQRTGNAQIEPLITPSPLWSGGWAPMALLLRHNIRIENKVALNFLYWGLMPPDIQTLRNHFRCLKVPYLRLRDRLFSFQIHPVTCWHHFFGIFHNCFHNM